MLYLLGQDQILFKPFDSEEPYTLDNGLQTINCWLDMAIIGLKYKIPFVLIGFETLYSGEKDRMEYVVGGSKNDPWPFERVYKFCKKLHNDVSGFMEELVLEYCRLCIYSTTVKEFEKDCKRHLKELEDKLSRLDDVL